MMCVVAILSQKMHFIEQVALQNDSDVMAGDFHHNIEVTA
jgi:hypothetical protein